MRDYYPRSHFRLGNDIDLTAYLASGGAGHAKWGNSGWMPITEDIILGRFNGSFDGNGRKVIGLWINRSSSDSVGLFGSIREAEIKNLGVEIAAVGIRGNNGVGGLVGWLQGSSIANSYATGDVSTTRTLGAGGLIGWWFEYDIDIVNSYRYQFAAVEGAVRSENTPNNIHGGIVTASSLCSP